jgi:predicted peptidase
MRSVGTGQWEEEVFGDLRYRVLLPHDYSPERKYPLVVFLHGSGERGSDNVAQITKGVGAFNTRHVRGRFPCIVVAPQAPAGGSFGGAWYPNMWTTQNAVVALVKELSTRRTVDVNCMYLTGLSMGAIGGWEILVRHPGLFAAAMLVCGEPKVGWADSLAGVPIWAFHGSRDDVVPVEPARALCAELARRGSPVKWTEYSGVGHTSWDRAFGEAQVYDWLFEQKRG